MTSFTDANVNREPLTRKLIVLARRAGERVKDIARMFGVSRKTVHKWCKRANHRGGESFRDKPRRRAAHKITPEVEEFIMFLRVVFDWGTGRIQQGLLSLPPFAYNELPRGIRNVKGVSLSRTSINNILRKHKRNGYSCHTQKVWKFFRAKRPDELWQLDFKGPVTIQGKKYWFVVCIDDYSRYLVLLEQIDHCPTTMEVALLLMRHMRGHKPLSILTDNGAQFSVEWENFCEEQGIKALFAHPYYPQDKGKVERTIRNVAEEFTDLLTKFPHWLNGAIKSFRFWYNNSRIHRGIGTMPRLLYM